MPAIALEHVRSPASVPIVIHRVKKLQEGIFLALQLGVSYYPRIGKSKISGTLKGTFGAGWFIISLILRYYFRRRRGASRPA